MSRPPKRSDTSSIQVLYLMGEVESKGCELVFEAESLGLRWQEEMDGSVIFHKASIFVKTTGMWRLWCNHKNSEV